jgi:hypothetical protein
MVTIYHFIFELIKILILGCIYATLTFVIFKSLGRFKPDSWFDRFSKRKLRFWLLSAFVISVGLVFFMFSYYGDHGLGDDARVPIGYGRAIQEMDARQAYIQDEGPIPMLTLKRFIVTDQFVYGVSGEEEDNYDGNYFVYDLEKNSVTSFVDQSTYLNHLRELALDRDTNYKDFNFYYTKYWTDLRFWLLP